MFDKFSEEAVKLIMHALEEARLLKHREVGSEHLLLGFFASGSDCIPTDFTELGIDLITLRAAVARINPKGSKTSPKELSFNDEGKAVLVKSYENSRHGVIFPKHMMLALLDVTASQTNVAMRAFGELKIDLSELRIPVIYKTQFQETALAADGSVMSERDAKELCREIMAVISFAMEETRRMKHNFLGAEMLLLGLVGAGDKAAQILETFDVTLDFVREKVGKLVGQGSDLLMVEVPFTPRAKKLLDRSLGEALKLGQSAIDERHLLLGFTHEQDGFAWQVLREKGVDLAALRESVLALFEETR